MNGSRTVFVDSSVLIALLAGDPSVFDLFVDRSVHLSFVSEMEVLAWPKLRPEDLSRTRKILAGFRIVELSAAIKAEAIGIRRQRLLKLPDSIIAATAMAGDHVLYTADAAFKRVGARLDVRVVRTAR